MITGEVFKLFDIKEGKVERFLSEMVYPEVDSISEEEIYRVLIDMRKIRNKLIKFQLELRKFKLHFSKVQDQNDLCKANVISKLLEDPGFLKLKTKEERDMLIYKNLVLQPDFNKSLDEYQLRLSTLSSSLVLAVSEFDKIFNEFELIYNIGKLNSYGYLISQANSKLNSLV